MKPLEKKYFGIIFIGQAFSVTSKNRQMSIKLPKNDFSSKIKDFDTFTKIA